MHVMTRQAERTRTRIVLLVALLAGLVFGTFTEHNSGRRDRNNVTILASWSFNLADPRQVFSFAPFVVVGKVEEQLQAEDGSILYGVRVVDELKGATPGRVIIRQTGFEDEGVTYQLEEQPLLDVGGTYVLALTVPTEKAAGEVLTLVGGTVSGQPVSLDDHAQLERLRGAVTAAVWPDALVDSAEFLHEQRGRQWADERAAQGFVTPWARVGTATAQNEGEPL